MANKRISGLTVAISADTSGVTKGLKDITSDSIRASNNLKQVDALLKLDPENVDLLATRQKLLSSSIETTARKLEILKNAQADVNREFQAGKISDAEYIAFQKELVNTEKRLNELKHAENDAGKSAQKLGDDVDKADKETAEFSETLRSGLVAGAKTAVTAVGAVGTAAAAAIAGVVKLSGETAQLGDDIDKNSQKLGMSAKSYQEWSFVMEHSGSDIDKMTTAMKKLAEAATDPSDAVTQAFRKIGISMEDVAGMSQEELFSATITALQGMESGAERTAVANDLLGKSAMDLGALLNTSAEDTEAMRQQVHDLGGVMSDEAVKSAAAYQDSLQNMEVAVNGIKNSIASDFLPAITSVMDGISGVLSGSDDGLDTLLGGVEDFVRQIGDTAAGLQEKFTPIVSTLVEGMGDAIPAMLGIGTDILLSLVDGIVKALPGLAKAAVDIVLQLVDGVLKLLPSILGAGVDVLTTLVDGIAKALPKLIPAAVEAVTTLVKGLSDSLPSIIDAAISLISGLSEGLIAAIPVLLKALPDIIDSLMNGLLGGVPKIINAGITLLTSITKELPKIIETIVEVLPEIVTAIADAIKENMPEIVTAGFDLMTSLLDALPDIIAQVITAIPLIVSALEQAVTAKFPEMAKCGMDLFTQLSKRGDEICKKIAELIPTIIEKIKEAFMDKYEDIQRMGMGIFDNIGNGFNKVLGDAWEWGSDLIANFVSGIRDNIDSIISAAADAAGAIWEYLHFSEPEKGPLADFSTYAPDMMHTFADGIKENQDVITAQFNSALSGIRMPSAPQSTPTYAGFGAPVINVSVSVGSIAGDYDVNRMTDQMITEMSAWLAQLSSRQAALVGG